MSKKIGIAVLLGIFVMFAVGTSFALTIKLGNVLSMKHPWNICLTGFAKDVKAATNGRVVFKIYPSSQLGNEKDLIEGMRLGTVDAGLIGGASFQSIEPKMGVEELPYAWKTHQAAYRAFDGELGDLLFSLLARKGIIGLAWWENGFRNITNNVRPIYKPSDLKGLKLRVTPIKMRLDTFKVLGASPMPIPFGELYTALQQGTVDGQENPLAIIYSAGFYEVQKYLSLTGHIWGSGVLCVRKGVWNKISSADKKVVLRYAYKWRDREREMIQQSDKTLTKKLKEKGMKVNSVNKAPFQKAVQPVWKEYEPVFGKKIMELVRKYSK